MNDRASACESNRRFATVSVDAGKLLSFCDRSDALPATSALIRDGLKRKESPAKIALDAMADPEFKRYFCNLAFIEFDKLAIAGKVDCYAVLSAEISHAQKAALNRENDLDIGQAALMGFMGAVKAIDSGAASLALDGQNNGKGNGEAAAQPAAAQPAAAQGQSGDGAPRVRQPAEGASDKAAPMGPADGENSAEANCGNAENPEAENPELEGADHDPKSAPGGADLGDNPGAATPGPSGSETGDSRSRQQRFLDSLSIYKMRRKAARSALRAQYLKEQREREEEDERVSGRDGSAEDPGRSLESGAERDGFDEENLAESIRQDLETALKRVAEELKNPNSSFLAQAHEPDAKKGAASSSGAADRAPNRRAGQDASQQGQGQDQDEANRDGEPGSRRDSAAQTGGSDGNSKTGLKASLAPGQTPVGEKFVNELAAGQREVLNWGKRIIDEFARRFARKNDETADGRSPAEDGKNNALFEHPAKTAIARRHVRQQSYSEYVQQLKDEIDAIAQTAKLSAADSASPEGSAPNANSGAGAGAGAGTIAQDPEATGETLTDPSSGLGGSCDLGSIEACVVYEARPQCKLADDFFDAPVRLSFIEGRRMHNLRRKRDFVYDETNYKNACNIARVPTADQFGWWEELSVKLWYKNEFQALSDHIVRHAQAIMSDGYVEKEFPKFARLRSPERKLGKIERKGELYDAFVADETLKAFYRMCASARHDPEPTAKTVVECLGDYVCADDVDEESGDRALDVATYFDAQDKSKLRAEATEFISRALTNDFLFSALKLAYERIDVTALKDMSLSDLDKFSFFRYLLVDIELGMSES